MRKSFFAVALVLALAAPAFGQSAIEELAKQQIAQRTGLHPNFLATLFVTEGENQFILAFIYVNEKTMQSQLKPELKQAVAPYLHKRALLTLLAPAKASTFDPLRIQFSQNLARFLLSEQMMVKITPDFQAGRFESGAVSAGILLLNDGLDLSKPFRIHYGQQSAVFSLTGETLPAQPNPFASLLLLLQFLFFNILLFFLIPFLLGL
ncbi:hypothetical protein LM602_03830 [Candidatus Acetothermia bacterium]|jgi:hypothetical protein|nr:hypothetical protein [Candidatus Acetothermia bacterium]MCI2431671.1 hypothetical protein [Candidatus Acetothermia bacterium]MCI2436387.1 hypothetical protein [Candidatus Acetothermia bacterium]